MKSYCCEGFVYKVREILPYQWYVQVYWRNPNGSRGGICRLMDELDGDDCRTKVYSSPLTAQKFLDRMAQQNGWEVFEE